MNEETLEHVSSLMDGELSRETGLFLTRRICADGELTATWERYHLIRDCIRQPGGKFPLVDLSARMREALSGEEAAPVSPWVSSRWLRPVTGMAVAVSVALMAIVTVGPDPLPQNPAESAGQVAQPFSSPNILPVVPRTQAASFSPQAQGRDARLNSYLLRHNQASGSLTAQGFIGFAPIVSSAESEDLQDGEEGTDDSPQTDPR
jgi:negative regulator of sigma E activity